MKNQSGKSVSADNTISSESALSEEELRALVPQLQELTEKYKRAERIQKALLDISELASTASELSTLYETLHEIIGSFMNAENFFIAFYEKADSVINFAYFVDEYDEQVVKKIPMSEVGEGITGFILKSGNHVVVRKNEWPALVSKYGIKVLGEEPEHFMGVPLKRGNQVIGAMVVQTYNPEVIYSQADLEVFLFVSQHIVTTLDRVKRIEITERTIRDRTRQLREMNDELQEEILERQRAESLQQALFEISELAANLEGDVPTFYSNLHEILSRLIVAPNCYIALLNEDKDHLEFPYFSDTLEKSAPVRKLGLGLTEFVLRTGQAELISPTRVLSLAEAGELDIPTAQNILNRSNTWLGAPLHVSGEIAGVIAVQSYGSQASYNNKDLELLKFVSQHIAAAMERKSRTEEIQRYNAELEARVHDRTEELNSANSILKRQIQERKEIELKLIHDAHHDNLTDLPNRSMFVRRLELAIASKQRRPETFYAVLFIDLDRFKMINDTLGHHAGDAFLIEVARRITECIRGHDLLARLGGDEFVVLLDNFDSDADVEEVASRIIESIAQPFTLEGHDMFSGASIGIAHLETYYKDADEVVRDADAAMYQAKSDGRGRYVLFDNSMRERLLEDLELENQLHKNLRHGDFQQFVQPVVNMQSNEIIYHEFYLRWEHPTLGKVARDQFRHVADQSGLSLELDMYQLASACRCVDNNIADINKIAVNISINHLLQNSAVTKIIDEIKKHNVNPSNIVFEFNENDLNRRSQFILPAIKKLKRFGVTLVLDNFGSGLASLSYLFSYPFDYIKVDHRFVRSLPRSQRNLQLIQSVMLISEHLHFDVIADGINTEAQLDALNDMGAKYGQGNMLIQRTDISESSPTKH